MTEAASGHLIELRVNNVAQFHTGGRLKFRYLEKDKDAEEYIVGWARELSADLAIRM